MAKIYGKHFLTEIIPSFFSTDNCNFLILVHIFPDAISSIAVFTCLKMQQNITCFIFYLHGDQQFKKDFIFVSEYKVGKMSLPST